MRLMQKMGVNMEELPEVTEVSIKTGDKTIIIENPTVTVIKMQDQNMYQVSGGDVKETVRQAEPTEEDVKLVAEQTGKSLDEARQALMETEGDLAKAILRLKEKQA